MIIATAPITDIILITFCGSIKCSLKKLNDIEVSGDIAIQHIHFPLQLLYKNISRMRFRTLQHSMLSVRIVLTDLHLFLSIL